MDRQPPAPGLRRCLVLALNRVPEGARKAWFHQFAQSSDSKIVDAIDPMPVAIVEYDDGAVDSVYVKRVQFLDVQP